MSAIDDCEERIQKEAYQRGYEQGKKDALLQKENLQISTVIGYESGYEEGAKAERERVLDDVAQYIQKHTHCCSHMPYMPLWVVTKEPLLEFMQSLRSGQKQE